MKAYLIVGVASLTSFSAWASCSEPPAPPAPPSGAAATRAEMLTAQTAIKDYNAAVIVSRSAKERRQSRRDPKAGDIVEQTRGAVQRGAARVQAKERCPMSLNVVKD
jgi:hypothetical protein